MQKVVGDFYEKKMIIEKGFKVLQRERNANATEPERGKRSRLSRSERKETKMCT